MLNFRNRERKDEKITQCYFFPASEAIIIFVYLKISCEKRTSPINSTKAMLLLQQISNEPKSIFLSILHSMSRQQQ